MTVVRTQFTVTSTDEEFSVPGDLNAAQIIASYSTQVPALRNMAHTESVRNVDGVGSVRFITFSPRTGTKG